MNEKNSIKKMSLLGIFGNILLFAFKLIAGFVGGSGAMISDAVHSLSDVMATMIAAIGVKISGRGADNRHPYGHERFECVASLLLGLILSVTGLGIGCTGIRSILTGNYQNEIPTILPLIAAIVSIAVKEFMYQYTMYHARKINSDAFRADAWHHRSDAFSSIGSFIGILGARMGFPIMDPLASLIICLFILKVSINVLKDSLDKMLDTSCSPEFEKALRKNILSHRGVVHIDRLFTRKFGSKVYVELEIAVDRYSTLIEAHRIAEQVHHGIEGEYPEVKDVMVHVNPSDNVMSIDHGQETCSTDSQVSRSGN